MRVLMLSELYPPHIGGVEQHVRNLSQGLVARGHEVTVATMAAPGLDAPSSDGDVSVARLRGTIHRLGGIATPEGRPHAPPVPDPEVVRAVGRLIERDRPDIVHAHNWIGRSYVTLKPRVGAPFVLSLHNYGVVCAKQSFMYKGRPCTGPGFSKCLHCAAANYGTARGMAIAMGNWAMQPFERRAVDMFLPVSRAVAEGNRLAELGRPYEVLPNFVPDNVAARRRGRKRTLDDQLPSGPFWLYVGTLSRHKGVHVLLNAYEQIEGAPPLVLIGPPWYDTPAEFPANTVVIRGLPHEAVMEAWSRAALGIVPSVFPDPCPTVAMEAMASGVPLVASRVGGLPDLVADGETGLLVPPSDPSALRSALTKMLHNPAEADRMRMKAKSKVKAFMATVVLDQLLSIYDRVSRDSERERA